MNVVPAEYLRYFILLSVIVYFIFDFFEQKKVKDEREEFLKLKTFELVQKITLFSVSVLAIAYLLYPEMPAYVPIIIITICGMYTEIIGKTFLRRKY